MAYLAAIGEARGPIYSGWMLLLLVVAVLLCGLAVGGGLVVQLATARLGMAVGSGLLLVAAAGYGVVLFLMLRRYAPEPLGVAAVSAGPVAGLFLAGALLGGLAHLRRDGEP